MERRASIPPGLPRSQPTISYWQDPPDIISDLRTTSILPEHVNIVIVGSGITGASIAYHLLSEQPQRSIVLLEAREAASGASGRNGRLLRLWLPKLSSCISLALIFVGRSSNNLLICRRPYQRGILQSFPAECQVCG